MAQEASDASVASSSPTPNWWEIHANPLSSWHTINTSPLTSSASSCVKDISISISDAAHHPFASTVASTVHSALSMDSSSADLSGELPESHLWSQVLLSVGSGGDMHHNHDDGENFLEALSSKSIITDVFNPACDYLKKMDSSWEMSNPSNGYNGALIEHERLTNLSDLVSNWSIAPPNPRVDHQISPSLAAHYSSSNLSYLPYMHDIKAESHHQDIVSSEASFLRSFSSSGIGCQVSLSNPVIGLSNKFPNAVSDVPWSGARNISDIISFKPVDFCTSKPILKGLDSSDAKKQGYESPQSTRGSGRSTGTTSEGKKKRSEDNNSDAIFKKSKQENSSASSTKLQVPKAKLGDRITALQQIVSPFGKTDTASVLMEAINYIRFLQEQVQLLSDPYMKSNAAKDHNAWGGMERKEKGEQKLDLRSRGLCLVPISCTPQIYRENSGPDYWTPTYRGCLYR